MLVETEVVSVVLVVDVVLCLLYFADQVVLVETGVVSVVLVVDVVLCLLYFADQTRPRVCSDDVDYV